MKNDFSISVKKPCSEKFENFIKTKRGGFCDSCEKEVINFTQMNHMELVNFFKNSSNTKTCGRFTTSQLKTYNNNLSVTNNSAGFLSRSIGVMSFSLLSLCAVSTISAQDSALNESLVKTEISTVQTHMQTILTTDEKYSVKGIVLDEQNLPLPGVSVVLKGTTIGTITDLDGKFEFSKALEVDDILVFSYLGYETKEYVIPESESSTLDISITFDAIEIELMGEVIIDGPYKSKRNIFQKFTGLFK